MADYVIAGLVVLVIGLTVTLYAVVTAKPRLPW